MVSNGVREMEESDIQVVVDETGFGKFNLKVALLCSLIYLNTGFSISSIGLVLPSAACDFRMSTVDKGRISAIPMLGMMCGSYFWGCLADFKGRKYALTAALLLHGGFEFASSFVPTYWCFVVLKYLSGVSISGQSGLVFTYLGEFQPTKVRHKILCWLEMAWTAGIILLPLVGWAIIPLKINYNSQYFFFHSWNLFVLVCSLPSLIIGFWIMFFPETPKYLAETGQTGKLIEVLGRIYSENTGKPPKEYFKKIMSAANSTSSILSLCEAEASNSSGNNNENSEKNVKASMTETLRAVFSQTLELFRPPYLRRTLNVIVVMFSITSSYYTLMLWFPELFQRFAKYEQKFPGQSASICEVSKGFRAVNETLDLTNDIFDCQIEVQTDVYIHTLVLGLACVPLSIALPLTVNRTGYKFYLVACSVLSAGVAVGLFFIKSSLENLILSCFFEALLSVSMSIIFCAIVDLFPTNLRVMAAALSSFCGRLGALIGNTLFGYLIDNYCITLIGVIIVQLCVSAVFGLLIPGKDKMQRSQSEQTHC